MNEQLQKELAAWLSQLREATQSGASFAIDQAPKIVQEKIIVGRVEETVFFVALVALTFGLAWFVRHVSRDDYPSEGAIIGSIFAGIGMCITAVLSFVAFHNAAMAWFAPRIYVIEWLVGMVKAS